MHRKRVCIDFEINILGGCYDLYVQSYTLLLANVFENLRNMFMNFYSYLNVKNTNDAEYLHRKRICIDFGINTSRGYYDLYVQSYTLLLANVFENLRNMFMN